MIKANWPSEAKGESIVELLNEASELPGKIDEKNQLTNILNEINHWLESLPITSADVPVGEDEESNIEIRKYGQIPEFDFLQRIMQRLV